MHARRSRLVELDAVGDQILEHLRKHVEVTGDLGHRVPRDVGGTFGDGLSQVICRPLQKFFARTR